MMRLKRTCRRRWAQRGRGLADFVFGFTAVALSHVMVGAFHLGRWIACRSVALVRPRPRQGPPPRRRQPAAECGPPAHDSWCGHPVPFRPIAEKPNVGFGDIAGLEKAKLEIRLRMILPVLHPEEAKRYGVRQGGGLLLYGPPGTGKTMLARAVANEVDAVFYHVTPSDIMSAAVGQAEANVNRLFRTLRQEKRAVLFLDEVEALVPSRRRNGSTIMRRVVSQMLGEVDGLAEASPGHVLLFIGATNEPDMIDPAMLRPGRFDAKVFVGLPERVARHQILASKLTARPVDADVDLDVVAERTEGLSGAELAGLVETAADSAFLRAISRGSQNEPIGMGDLSADLPGPASQARFNGIDCRTCPEIANGGRR